MEHGGHFILGWKLKRRGNFKTRGFLLRRTKINLSNDHIWLDYGTPLKSLQSSGKGLTAGSTEDHGGRAYVIAIWIDLLPFSELHHTQKGFDELCRKFKGNPEWFWVPNEEVSTQVINTAWDDNAKCAKCEESARHRARI